jgi:hypothetical protein
MSRTRVGILAAGAVVWTMGWTALHQPSPAAAAPPAFSRPGVALLTYDLPAGSHGGSHPGGVWSTRDLNTQVYDPANIVALNGSQFTLKAGTYLIEANQSIFGDVGNAKGFKGRIRNVTDDLTAAVSLSVRLHEETNESATVVSPIPRTLLTLAAPKTFELQFFCETADPLASGLGYFLPGSVEVERYASVFIEKLE